jgi:HD-GYP domain-containing protein (c-di-GMP phosphodiesterase class II)
MFADTIDAMTSDRPYRAALGEAQVRAELAKMSGRQFDPHMCEILLSSPHFKSLFRPEMKRHSPVQETAERPLAIAVNM